MMLMTAYGLNILPDLGYPAQTGYQPNRLQWVSSTLSHNTVMVNERQQEANAELRGNCLHFDHTQQVKLADVDASYVYPDIDIYRRTLIMIRINETDSYTVDFFRILGGTSHLYSLHAASDMITEVKGLHLVPQVNSDGNYIGSYAGADVPYGPDPNSPAEWFYNTQHPRGSTWAEHIERDNSPADQVSFCFPIRDYLGHLENSADIGLSVTMLNHRKNENANFSISFADAYPPSREQNKSVSKLKYVFAQYKGESLDTVFTTVFEPYRTQKHISAIETLSMVPISFSPTPASAFRALKITLDSGRCDYIMYSTDNTQTFQITDGNTQFLFRGFAGVIMMENGVITYRYANDSDIIADRYNLPANLVGVICDFTHSHAARNTIDVSFAGDISDATVSALKGKYIYIDNGRTARSGTYRILNAYRSADTVTLDIGRITLIRKFRDAKKPELGYIYNISKGQSFRIPLSYEE